MLKKVLFSLIIALSLISCNNEVDLNDEYQEITIVYGLLNHNDTRHYIKITKAFQADGNVYIAAQDPNKSEFYEAREVWLDEYYEGSYLKTISLDTVRINTKEEGVFYYPTQLVYATSQNVQLSPSNTYYLFIKNKTTGKVIKSNTSLIPDFEILRPSPTLPGNNVISFNSIQQTIEWKSAVNGKLYQVTIRFFYSEDSLGTTVRANHIDLLFPSVRCTKKPGDEKLNTIFANSSFFQNIANHLNLPNPNVIRYVDSIQYIFDVADENFTVYMDVNKPSNNIVQERPAFSNIENGIGIFASRYSKIKKFDGLHSRSMDTLMKGRYTKDLNFKIKP